MRKFIIAYSQDIFAHSVLVFIGSLNARLFPGLPLWALAAGALIGTTVMAVQEARMRSRVQRQAKATEAALDAFLGEQ